MRSGIRSCVGGLIAAKEGGQFKRITIKVCVRLEERCHRFVCLGEFELTGPLILAVERFAGREKSMGIFFGETWKLNSY